MCGALKHSAGPVPAGYAAGLDCVRRAAADGDLHDAQQRAAAVTRAAAYALQATVAEHRALAALRQQLVAELAEARAT